MIWGILQQFQILHTLMWLWKSFRQQIQSDILLICLDSYLLFANPIHRNNFWFDAANIALMDYLFRHTYINSLILYNVYNNISSVVEFQRWWLLKSKLFGQESTWHQRKIFKKILRVLTVCQKVPKLSFQTQFWISNINQIFSKKIFI